MNLPELPPAQFLRVDLFPALVSGASVPDGVLDRVRLVVTDAHVHVLRLTALGDIELAHTAELDTIEKAHLLGARGVKIVTADGDHIEAIKSPNCGCGMTRMKSAKFFNPMPATRAMT
jgi:hypothetical protein